MFKSFRLCVSAVILTSLFALASCTTPATPAPPPPAPTSAPSAPTVAPTAIPPTQVPATAATSADSPFTVTDALNRTVKFDRLPQRIAMAGKGFFMAADAMYLFPEARTRLVALPKVSPGGQANADAMTLVDPTLESKILFTGDVGAEQIAPAKPDVVILKSGVKKLGDSLEQINIPVVYVDFETPEQYTRDLTTLGQVLGNPERAQKLTAYYQDLVDSLNSKVKDLKDSDKPQVLLLQYSTKNDTVAFSVPPKDWLQTKMVEIAGGNPIWTEASEAGGFAVVNLEQIATWNPEMVFVVNYFGDPSKAVEKLKADPKWQSLAAVKNNKIYAFPGDYYSWDQPDPRWGLGLAWLAAKIQPTLFGDTDMKQAINDFYALYGIDQATVQSKVMPLLKGDLE